MSDVGLKYFKHLYLDNKRGRHLFLLHGTGGDEQDLLPLVKGLEASYNFVGLLGNVREQGMPRFFARDERGVLDQASIVTEAEKLAEFIKAWQHLHAIQAQDTAFLGYSNGANMIAALALLYPQIVRCGVLLHPLLPIKEPEVDLAQARFLVSYGEQDQMISADQTKELITTLQRLGAAVEVVTHEGGHEIRPAEVVAFQHYLA